MQHRSSFEEGSTFKGGAWPLHTAGNKIPVGCQLFSRSQDMVGMGGETGQSYCLSTHDYVRVGCEG